jgi:hypothetical protein
VLNNIFTRPGEDLDRLRITPRFDRFQTYRVTGRLRASWPVDAEHQCSIGCDPTGQDTDPKAASIAWLPRALPRS